MTATCIGFGVHCDIERVQMICEKLFERSVIAWIYKIVTVVFFSDMNEDFRSNFGVHGLFIEKLVSEKDIVFIWIGCT